MNTVEKIISLLKINGIEQKDLAKELGIRPSAISEWKSGTTKSYMKHIDDIAKFLGVPVGYLLGSKDDSLSATAKEFIEIAAIATHEEMEKILDYAKLVINNRKNPAKRQD